MHTMCMSHELCVWVTEYVYASRTMYAVCGVTMTMHIYADDVHESRTMPWCVWVKKYACVQRQQRCTYIGPNRCSASTVARTRCICAMNYTYESQTTWVTNVMNYTHESRTVCVGHELCILVTNYVHETQTMYTCHDHCIWVTKYVYESRTIYIESVMSHTERTK